MPTYKATISALFLIFFASDTVFSQVRKSVELLKSQGAILGYSYDIETKGDIFVYLHARNSEYEVLVDYITLTSGSPVEVYDFLSQVEVFSEKDVDLSTQIGNQTIRTTRLVGMKYVFIYDEDYNDDYHLMRPKNVKRFREKLGDWMQLNNIPLTAQE